MGYFKALVAGAVGFIALFSPTVCAFAQVSTPITNFIFIIQENHSFDNYFGTFPNANGIPPNTALPEYPGGPPVVTPFLITEPFTAGDLSHSWSSVVLAYDNGAMDGFLWAEWPTAAHYYGASIPVPTPNPALVQLVPKTSPTPTPSVKQLQKLPSGEVRSPNGFADDEDDEAPDIEEQNEKILMVGPTPSGTPNWEKRPAYIKNTLGYYDASIIPNYWQYASTFTLCDEFFSSLSGPSQPNHLYVVAAQSGGLVQNILGPYNEAIYSFNSIIELLGGANISWTYYVSVNNPTSETLWNPLLASKTTRGPVR